MTITTVTPINAALIPTRSDTVNFAERTDTFLGTTLPTMVTEINTTVGGINSAVTDITTKQGIASAAAIATAADAVSTSEDAAATAADVIAAAASAASAAAIAGAFVGTSATSWTPAVETKAFTTQAGEQYTAGIWVTIVSAASGANNGYGQVVSYSGTTLTVDVQVASGSGAHTDWNISIAGPRGPAGTGITEQTTGFTATGGTTPKTLTVDASVATSALAPLAGATLTDLSFTRPDKGSVGTGTVTFSLNDGNVQKLTVTGNLTIATSNWATTGDHQELLIQLVNGGSATITLPTINWVKPDGSVTTTFATYLTAIAPRTGFQASGTDFVLLWSVDAGTTVHGKLV